MQRVLPIVFFLIFTVIVSSGAYANPDPFDLYLPSELETIEAEKESAPSIWDDFEVGGYLKNELAYRLNSPRTITKIRTIGQLESRYPIKKNIIAEFTGWAYYDLVYDLIDYDTITARYVRDENQPLVFVSNLNEEKDSPVIDVKELYIDFLYDDIDIRFGKQFVVWGVLDGVRITDEINPMDFRELILLDLLDYRIALWTLKLNLYRPSYDVELLWIPQRAVHKPAPSGSEWELLQTVPNTRLPDDYSFRNAEYGAKVSFDKWNTEFSLSYFYTWDDFPAVFRAVEIDSPEDPIFFPTHTRNSLYGGTFIKTFGSYILKGEAAFVTDKYFGTVATDKTQDGFLDFDGEVKKDHIRWGLGLDFNINGIDISPAVVQWVILDYTEGIIQDKFDTSVNVFMRKPMPESDLEFRLLAIYLINLNDLFMQPKLIYDVTDKFQIITGLDLFFGERSTFGPSALGGSVAAESLIFERPSAQFFGNFKTNNRLVMNFKYNF